MVKRIVENDTLIDPNNIEIVENWSQFFLQKGVLAGLNFFREYLSANGWSDRQLRNLEILYYQCSFCRDNSIGTYHKDETEEYRQLLNQFSELQNCDRYIQTYKHKGEFLKADTLMLLRSGQNYRILCVDLSIFSVKSAEDLIPLDNVEVMRNLLIGELGYLRSKSVFSKLRIDTGSKSELGFELSRDLRQYFTAFKRQDKESAKLIQAASYAHSFYRFLREAKILIDEASVVFNVVGYSDRNVNTLSLRPENLDLLATCAEIYKQEPKQQDIKTARQKILHQIQRSAARSFIDGKTLVEKLSTQPVTQRGDGITQITHTERIDGFFNSIGMISDELAIQLEIPTGLSLRNAHANLIEKALISEDTYLFLTGNPGIGKTTAIANFLRSHLDEGFLFFYVSPRKQVNLDIIDKFKSGDRLADDRLFCLNSNSVMIRENGGRPTVQYHSNRRQDNFTAQAIDFIHAESKTRSLHPPLSQKRLDRIADDRFRDVGDRTAGVLASICEGIHTAIADELSHNIIATVSIQSLRVTPKGGNTLRHLTNIFKSAYNSREKRVIPARMRAISQRIKHVFIMIDEITGDDSGVQFLQGIKEFLHKCQLTDPQHGFNVKIIVADASIVDPEVITQHLSETSPEPDKIYFRLAKQAAAPLSVQSFQFKRLGARVINANSYPACHLDITYKIFLESVKFTENLFQSKDKPLIKTVQAQIAQDINALLADRNSGQILVYIQDKQRLQQLIETIRTRQGQFDRYVDYLEIHASLSEAEKAQIQQYKQEAKVVFMTSSASRGLSFPKAKHILVEIPRFQIEKNLMEVIQVIYRSRGEYWENGKPQTLDGEDKNIIFYLCDRAIYYPSLEETSDGNDAQERQLSIQESVLSVLNILLILKVSIMTRILGAGRLGRKDCLMIPIGGKSVSAAGNTFTTQIANLIRELKNEYRRQPSHITLKEVFTSLEQLLSHAEFVLMNDSGCDREVQKSYLSLREEFNQKFSQLCVRLDKLLEFGNLEPGHITGSLLVVPIYQKLAETYQIRLEQQIRQYATDGLIKKMLAISNSQEYPENLKSAIRGGAIELVELLNGDIARSQWFEQKSQNPDQYYALPLLAFIGGEAMREYFKSEPEEEEDTQFRTLLSRYVHSLYPAYNTLPIGRQYREFPFLIFRSYSLPEMRAKMFSDKYLLNSNELNVLNLILS